MTAAPLLRADGLWVRFGAVLALRNVSLEVYPGEYVALMGANGSGKTTLLRVLAGIERASLGRALVGKLDAWRERAAVWRALELLTPDEKLPGAFHAQACLRLFSPDASEREIEARAERLFAPEVLGLAETHRRVPLERLSVGMRQKVALATIGEKSALLLDEPSEGLDPIVCHRYRTEARRGGRTVLTVTHDLREAEAADRVAVIRDGTLRGFGPPAVLARWLGVDGLEAAYERLTRPEGGLVRAGVARVAASPEVAPGTFVEERGPRGAALPEEVVLGRLLLRKAGERRAPAGTAAGRAVLVSPPDAALLSLDGDDHPRRSICHKDPGDD